MAIYKVKFINGGKMRVTSKTEFLARLYASQYGTVASCEETVSRWWYLVWVVLIGLGFYAGQML